jgi:hypothetical protein
MTIKLYRPEALVDRLMTKKISSPQSREGSVLVTKSPEWALDNPRTLLHVFAQNVGQFSNECSVYTPQDSTDEIGLVMIATSRSFFCFSSQADRLCLPSIRTADGLPLES